MILVSVLGPAISQISQHCVHKMTMDQPLGYTTYHYNDVLCGRGRYIREHSGNRQFISLVKEFKSKYVCAQVKEKRLFANLIVRRIRSMDPPGRFLKRCHITHQWVDIGDHQAVSKARQALREGAPDIMKQLGAGKTKIVDNNGGFVETKTLILPIRKESICKERPLEMTPTRTCNAKVLNNLDLEFDMCERYACLTHSVSSPICVSNSYQSVASAKMQPIPLDELPTIDTMTTRDEANNLLRILESEPYDTSLDIQQSPTTTGLSRASMRIENQDFIGSFYKEGRDYQRRFNKKLYRATPHLEIQHVAPISNTIIEIEGEVNDIHSGEYHSQHELQKPYTITPVRVMIRKSDDNAEDHEYKDLIPASVTY